MIYPSGVPISLVLTYQRNGEIVPFVGTLTHRLTSAGLVVETTQTLSEPQTEVSYSYTPPASVEGTLKRYSLFSFGILGGQTVMCRKHFSIATTDYLLFGCDEVRHRLGLKAVEISDEYIPVEETYIDLMGVYTEAFHTQRYSSTVLNSQFNKLTMLLTALTVLQTLPTLLSSREETDNHVFIRLGKGDFTAIADKLSSEAEEVQKVLAGFQNIPSYEPNKTVFLVGTRVNPLTGT